MCVLEVNDLLFALMSYSPVISADRLADVDTTGRTLQTRQPVVSSLPGADGRVPQESKI